MDTVKKRFKENNFVFIGIVCYFIALLLIAIFKDGTCDSGDSITHFLFSKYAFEHPENFLDHWAKPLFVLLSSPFAQFGFTGIKVFNCCIAALTVWLTYKTALILNYKNAWLAAIFLCFTPGYFIHIFSGLTEPLFALVVILGIYLSLSGRLWIAACTISFLPFIRSEGLIIIGVFAFYLIYTKQYKYLPILLTGHLIYSFVGAFYYHDLFWVFTKIPYANSSGKYGSGTLSHFFIQLNYIIGVPLYILLGCGVVKKIIELVSGKAPEHLTLKGSETLLLYAVFFAFFTAHIVFWYFGIFESMGLKRVLICITPLAILIALKGFNFIADFFYFNANRYRVMAGLLTGMVIIFPFVPNPAAVDWQRDLSPSADQNLIKQAAKYIEGDFPGNTFIYYTHPFISLEMDRDPFNKQNNSELKDWTIKKKSGHYLILWDNWFSVHEEGITLEQLKSDATLKLLKTFQVTDKGREIQVAVFENQTN
ncbi:MAG: glycosyltransferase family 87 protein [Bacteroidota bacterium]